MTWKTVNYDFAIGHNFWVTSTSYNFDTFEKFMCFYGGCCTYGTPSPFPPQKYIIHLYKINVISKTI